jgi:hypothetical protein
MFDLALLESGNGGDYQLKGNDLAVVNGTENMPYIAMFGGNIEQSTENNVVLEQSFDYWGNTLLMNANQPIQFNSTVERTLKNIALTSAGRAVIENAIIADLQFIVNMGIPISVSVSIPATDRIEVELTITLPTKTKVTILNFRKRAENGDFYLFDFNDDFF